MLRYRFQPKVVPTVLALAGALLTACLGDWQLDRAAHKAELQERLEVAMHQPAMRLSSDPMRAPEAAFHRVQALGQFLPEHTILLDNRVHKGVVGYEVVTPLKLEGGAAAVLVNRGWVQAPSTRDELPAVRTPGGRLTIEGIALPPPRRAFSLSGDAETGAVWQRISIERAQARVGTPLQPLVLQQTSDGADGLARDWPRPNLGIDTHRAYALQWFVMSGVILFAYVALNVRKRPESLGPA